MHWFILAALAMAAAALLWYSQAVGKQGGESVQTPAVEDGEAFRRWLDDPAVMDKLEGAVGALVSLMAHPKLGGPGFLTIRLPQLGEEGAVTVTAQYPNIREELYRRVVRRELERAELMGSGVPEELLELSPVFETDSGGVVAVSVRAVVMPPKVTAAVSGRTDRQAALEMLSDRLGERGPALEARPFGSELLLTPVREEVR